MSILWARTIVTLTRVQRCSIIQSSAPALNPHPPQPPGQFVFSGALDRSHTVVAFDTSRS